jgi:hypothetical protein
MCNPKPSGLKQKGGSLTPKTIGGFEMATRCNLLALRKRLERHLVILHVSPKRTILSLQVRKTFYPQVMAWISFPVEDSPVTVT